MHFSLRPCCLLSLILWLGLGTHFWAAEGKGTAAPETDQFQAPSIEALLRQLHELEPIPFEKVWRQPPQTPPQDRPRLALLTGRLIADGFLVLATERATRAEPVGRSLLLMAKALGFGNKITKRGREVMDFAKKEEWDEARKAMIRIQEEAESELTGLRDENLVALLSLGGWLRSLEITSAAVAEKYSVERSSALWQPKLARYFISRLSALPAPMRETTLVQSLQGTLGEIATEAEKEEHLSAESVKRVLELARGANEVMLK